MIFRERERFLVPLIYVFTRWFLYVPWLGIKLHTTLGYRDNAVTNEVPGQDYILLLFLKDFTYFREMGWEGEREGEQHQCAGGTSIGCLLHTPNWGPGLQPRHVPYLGIEPVTFWFTGRHLIHWATLARTGLYSWKKCSNYIIFI